MSGCWIAVASAEHVRLGHAHGFMQICHGKAARSLGEVITPEAWTGSYYLDVCVPSMNPSS